ncbi:hypothetical protein Q0M94_19400 (plasmid) [Deinococcus radiomollis]|uniref:hypothetical protein n=1 Tax=Deinococcus radiomollis TaxID=468916 RepID=UPI003891E7DE
MKSPLLLTAALLIIGGTARAAPLTLTLGGVTGPLQIGMPAKLSVTATGDGGTTPAFTSSDPAAVAVAADGTLTVRHLSVRPITLSVTEAGVTSTLDVTTFGLDFAGGTVHTDAPLVATAFTFRFADAAENGVSADSTLSVTGPAGFNRDMPFAIAYSADLKKNATGTYSVLDLPALNGAYTATLTAGGVTYRAMAVIDSASVLPLATGADVTATTQDVTVTGTLPVGAASLYVRAAERTFGKYVAATDPDPVAVLPVTQKWDAPLPSGTYRLVLTTRTYSGVKDGVMPDQVNVSNTVLPRVRVH